MRFKIDKISTDLDNLSKGIVRPDAKVQRSSSVGRADSAGSGAMSNYRARRQNMKKGIFDDIDAQMQRFKETGVWDDGAPGTNGAEMGAINGGSGASSGGNGVVNGRQSRSDNKFYEHDLPAQDADFVTEMQRQRQADSMHRSVDQFYQTGKMNPELAMTIVELGADKIAPSLSDEDVDFIMANFNFDQMAGQMKKMKEDEKMAAGQVQQRLMGVGRSRETSSTSSSSSSGASVRRSNSVNAIRSSIDSELSRGRSMFKPSKKYF